MRRKYILHRTRQVSPLRDRIAGGISTVAGLMAALAGMFLASVSMNAASACRVGAANVALAGADQNPHYGQQVAGYLGQRADAAYMFSSLTFEETIRRVLDARLDPTERRIFSYRVAAAESARSVESPV